jgi:hypothetical protein
MEEALSLLETINNRAHSMGKVGMDFLAHTETRTRIEKLLKGD